MASEATDARSLARPSLGAREAPPSASRKRARDKPEADMPALFLTSMPSGEHGDLDAIAALIDDADGDQCAPTHDKRKVQRSSGVGRMQVQMALSGLESDATSPPGAGTQQRSPDAVMAGSTAGPRVADERRNTDLRAGGDPAGAAK